MKGVGIGVACVAMAVWAAACGSGEDAADADGGGATGAQPTPEKRIESFYYEYGSEEMGYYTYSIMPQKDKDTVLVTLSSRTDPDKEAEREVPSALIDDLDKLIADNKLEAWDGFEESADGSVEGYSFQLTISYENGESIAASGYEAYPEDKDTYQGKHDAILALLDKGMQAAATATPAP